MRRAFTLIELLVVVAIIAIMVASGVVSVVAGQEATRLKGAVRDIYATIRHARSVALASQQPSIITYATVTEEGEPSIKIDITATKLMSQGVEVATTLSGETVHFGESANESVQEEKHSSHLINGKELGSPTKEQPTKTVEDELLFAAISSDVVRGLCVHVLVGDEELVTTDEERQKPKISVFSNVDYLIGRYQQEKAKKVAEEQEQKSQDLSTAEAPSTAESTQTPVSVVWQVNGRTEPHQVWIYRSGQPPESGFSIKIDRFGGAKVLAPGEEE